MSYKRFGKHVNKKPTSNQDRPSDDAKRSGSEIESRVSFAEPRMLDFNPNAPNKFMNWANIVKEYVYVFTRDFNFFSRIVSHGEHHDFGDPPRLTMEENDAIERIIPDALIIEEQWRLLHPLLHDQFEEHC
jgi:hypothetical protein